MHRIAPFGNTRPKHTDERGYLIELTIAVKYAFYDLEPDETRRALTLELLHEWDTTHRTPLALCSEWLTSRNELVEYSNHESVLLLVDEIIIKIRQGISERNPVAHIATADIEALERAYRALDVCKTQLIYY